MEPSPQADINDASSNAYDVLQQWYLARLRALSASRSKRIHGLTPLARIAADRQLIEKRVLAATATTRVEKGNHHRILALFVWMALAGVLVAATLLAPSFAWVFALGITAISLVFHNLDAAWCRRVWQTRLAEGLSIVEQPGVDYSTENLNNVEERFIEALIEARLKELSIADDSADILLGFDKDLKLMCWNARLVDVLGYSDRELEHLDLSQLIAEPGNENLRSFIEQKYEKQGFELHLRLVGKYGKLVDILLSGEWSERQKMFFSYGRDITASKDIERMRNEFIATISHDIRNPLQAALLALDSLDNGAPASDDAILNKVILSVQDNIVMVVDLISELLDLENCSERHLHLDKTNFNLRELVSETVSRVHFLAESRDIKFELDGTKHLNLHADRHRLSRVLLNLLINSIKFSPAGSTVTLQASEDSDGAVTISVSDQGTGVPAHLQQAVFEKYFQATASTDDQTPLMKGRGLGLAICKVFVEAHGGDIRVETNSSGGSTFSLTIPSGVDQK